MLELEENFKKNGGEFKKIKLVELFNYKRGTRITKQNRNQGKYPLITAGESFNGVKGYIDAGSNEIFCDAITVDMFCNVFLQCGEFCCDDNILVLKSKNKLTNEVLLYLCAAIAKSKPLFSYAHQYRQKDLVKHILILPVYYDGELAFDYMEQYVRELEAERVRELEAYLLASGLNNYQLADNEREILIAGRGKRKFKAFKFDEVFAKAQTGNFDIQRSHVNGKGCFYINSGLENQGIVGMTDVPAKIFKPETITVDMFGLAWYRDFAYKMATHAHVFSLSSLLPLSSNCLLYLTGTMFYLKKKYNYNNMCNWNKMLRDSLFLPVLENGDIDTAYMEAYIAALKKEVIKDVVKWKDYELEAYKFVTNNES